MRTLAWVVGSGGLLGSHVRNRLAAEMPDAIEWAPDGPPFPWKNQNEIHEALGRAATGFFKAVEAGGFREWAILWCAGAGVVGTPAEALESETRTWERFLGCVGDLLDDEVTPRGRAGRIFLASSAGGVYGNSPERPLNESSTCLPISAYGQAKLRQEEVLEHWSQGRADVSWLVARISNLYGPGQKMDKPQGLISHMARSVVLRHSIHIFVPLDTIRDYLYADDAARRILRWTRRLGVEAERRGKAQRVLKVCAAEEETTIASLIGVFRRVARRNVKVVAGIHPVQNQQPALLQFRSKVWTDEPRGKTTGILEGVGRVYRHQLALHQAGALPSPALRRP